MNKIIYVINTELTGVNGNIIHCTDSAYKSKRKALEVCNKMNEELSKNDAHFLAYVTGPIVLLEDWAGLTLALSFIFGHIIS